jgi:hypothetical protein
MHWIHRSVAGGAGSLLRGGISVPQPSTLFFSSTTTVVIGSLVIRFLHPLRMLRLDPVVGVDSAAPRVMSASAHDVCI